MEKSMTFPGRKRNRLGGLESLVFSVFDSLVVLGGSFGDLFPLDDGGFSLNCLGCTERDLSALKLEPECRLANHREPKKPSCCEELKGP